MKDWYGKTVLVTGGSSGIGKECCRLFAEDGYDVWCASRSVEGGGKEDFPSGGSIRYVGMDVTDGASVEKAVAFVAGHSGGIGVVINCAGIGIGGPSEDTPIEDVHSLMETNYFGVLRVNTAVLPFMRGAGKGLVLIVSSVAGLISLPYQGHYCSSKYALEAYTEALRMELRLFPGLKVSLIEPGDTKTGFTDARRMSIDNTSPYYANCVRSVAVMEKDERNGKPPSSSAQVALRLAQKKNPRLRNIVGADYKLLATLKKLLPAALIEFVVRKIYLK